MRDAIVVGYAEETWPQLLRDFAAGRMQPRYVQRPGLDAREPAVRRAAICCRGIASSPTTSSKRRAAASTAASSASSPPRGDSSRYQKPVEDVVADIRQKGARKLIFVDLNLIADRVVCGAAVRSAHSASRPVVRARHDAAWRRSAAARARRAERMPGTADRARIAVRQEPARHEKGLQQSGQVSRSGRPRSIGTASRCRDVSCSAWITTRRRSSSKRLASSSTRASTCRASPWSRRFPARRSTSGSRSEGRILTAQLGAVRRPARRLSTGADERRGAAARHRDGVAVRLQRAVDRPAHPGIAQLRGPCGLAPTSAIASTRTTCTVSTTATGSSAVERPEEQPAA